MPLQNLTTITDPTVLDAIVVGAGQAGLGVSYSLKRMGIAHVVLEKSRIGETWRSQRWDSFTTNSPNLLNGLPGAPYEESMPDGFYTRDELVRSFESYAQRFALPVRTGVEVSRVEAADGGGFVVRTRTDAGDGRTYYVRSVVIASGIMTEPKVPAFAGKLPGRIVQMHTAGYRNPAALPPGAVVVVGSGQSGVQIAEELNEAGREVYLCTSRVGRVPRRYRGREIMAWLWDCGFLDVARADLEDPAICRAAQPQVSGVGRYGHTLSLQKLSRDGVTLLGRLNDVDGSSLVLGDDLADNIRFADQKSAYFKHEVDAYIARAGIQAPPPRPIPRISLGPTWTTSSHLRDWTWCGPTSAPSSGAPGSRLISRGYDYRSWTRSDSRCTSAASPRCRGSTSPASPGCTSGSPGSSAAWKRTPPTSRRTSRVARLWLRDVRAAARYSPIWRSRPRTRATWKE